jgi:hypothetical protein
MDVEQQVAVEHEHVPAEHGAGKLNCPMPGSGARSGRAPQVHGDKGQAHEDGRHRQQFAEDDQVVQVLVVVDVDGMTIITAAAATPTRKVKLAI